jgi:hypothetical protein
MEQEQLDVTAGRFAAAPQPRGDDASLVEDEDVSLAKILRQIGKMTVFDAAVAREDHEPARVAALRRTLRDEFGGKLELVSGG